MDYNKVKLPVCVIEKALAGDEKAREFVVGFYEPYLDSIICKAIKNKKDYNVEDINQEARVVMVNVMKKFRIDRIFTNE